MKPYYSDDLVTLWHGRCEDVLPTLPANSIDAVICDPLIPYTCYNYPTSIMCRWDMDEQEIIRLYVVEDWTLRRIANQMGTNHHMIERILQRHGVELSPRTNRQPMTDEHRRKIGETSRGRVPRNKGIPASDDMIRRYMTARMRTSISLDSYRDVERLRLLTRLQAKHKASLAATDEQRKAFLDKFYFDDGFNAVYELWLASGKNRWYFPSLDHINPKSNGGDFDLDNLRFITWFENRAKADMPLTEWHRFRTETNTRSDLFIEDILETYRASKGTSRREGAK